MSIALQFAPITVSDVEEALTFYRDALGIPVANDVSSGGHRWVTLGDAGGAQIVLSSPQAGRSPADGEALEELVVKGALGPYVFQTNNLDALFDQAATRGAEVVSEPADQPWGTARRRPPRPLRQPHPPAPDALTTGGDDSPLTDRALGRSHNPAREMPSCSPTPRLTSSPRWRAARS